ncbi:MAG: hypothetical protein ACK5QS_06815 [Pseudanabaenaceae cyanobacterium]|jgi:hypothetical protein
MSNPKSQDVTTTSQPVTPTLDITPLITPISYSISAAIILAALAAFLRQLFSLGKE